MAKSKQSPAGATEPQGGDANGGQRKKTECPVTKEEFLKSAKPIAVVINGVTLSASPKEFSSGSFGFYLGDKVTVDVGGVAVKLQVGMSLTAIGSKPGK